MNRRDARKASFSLIYQLEFISHDEITENLDDFMNSYDDMDALSKTFIMGEFNGVWQNITQIDSLVSTYSKSWDIDRISKVDLAILRLSLYEILHCEDIPNKVSVNEAVELAKEFGGDESSVFVNGILGKIVAESEEGVNA